MSLVIFLFFLLLSCGTEKNINNKNNNRNNNKNFDIFDIFEKFAIQENTFPLIKNIKKNIKPFEQEINLNNIIHTATNLNSKEITLNIKGEKVVYLEGIVQHGGNCWIQASLALYLNYFSVEDWEIFFQNLQTLVKHPIIKILEKNRFPLYSQASQTDNFEKLFNKSQKLIFDLKSGKLKSISPENLNTLTKFIKQTIINNNILNFILEHSFLQNNFFLSLDHIPNFPDMYMRQPNVEQSGRIFQKKIIYILIDVLKSLKEVAINSDAAHTKAINLSVEKHFGNKQTIDNVLSILKNIIKDYDTEFNFLSENDSRLVKKMKDPEFKKKLKGPEIIIKIFKQFLTKIFEQYIINPSEYLKNKFDNENDLYISLMRPLGYKKNPNHFINWNQLIPNLKKEIQNDQFLFFLVKKLVYDFFVYSKNPYLPDLSLSEIRSLSEGNIFALDPGTTGVNFWGSLETVARNLNIYFPYEMKNYKIPENYHHNLNCVDKAYPIIFYHATEYGANYLYKKK